MPQSSQTIVIASVLKPVDDSRMFEKIGLSLADAGYDVHVMGCASARITHASITQHPHSHFRRFSIGRFFAPILIFSKALRIRPGLLIVTTHELLFMAMALKLFTKCRVIYDVQENYYWNILYTPAFPLLIKPFIAMYVRAKEALTSRYVDHFFLAERGYAQELSFVGARATVLENKVRIEGPVREAPFQIERGETLNLLFSGTLAESTGVFAAIELAVKLHVIDDKIRLVIIGFCAQRSVLEKIRLMIRMRPFIELITSDSPVPHQEIFERIRSSHAGLITYQINPSTMSSIPTKLYEYLGFRLPVILVSHKLWADFCSAHDAAIIFNPKDYDAAQLYKDLLQKTFYTSEPSEVFWKSEEGKLLEVVRRVLA